MAGSPLSSSWLVGTTLSFSLTLISLTLSTLPSLPPSLAASSSSTAFLNAGKSAPWHHGPFESVRSAVDKSVRSFLHSQAESPISIPLEVNIVLVGFAGDGGYRLKLDPEEIRWFLQRSFPIHRPANMDTGEELIIQHDISYTVLPVKGLELMVLEKELKLNMKRAGQRAAPDSSSLRLFDVEATKVEPTFDRLYSFLFGKDSSSSSSSSSSGGERGEGAEAAGRRGPSAIFLCNFDKVRMDPDEDHLGDGTSIKPIRSSDMMKQEAGYIYRYSYNGAGHSQTWLARGRYVVIDLSAGPTSFSSLSSPSGAVGPSSLPRVSSIYLPHSHANQPASSPTPPTTTTTAAATTPPASSRPQSLEYFRGAMSSVVVSAVEHLLSPDLRFEAVDVTHRVLVAVIVLRNHHHFNPLHDKHQHQHSIDTEGIKKQVQAMVAWDQEVVVVEGVHSLHDHPRLAVALQDSIRHSSAASVSPNGTRSLRTISLLDGARLLEEFRSSADMLASGLLEASHPALVAAFFNSRVPGLDLEAERRVEEGLLKKSTPPPAPHKRRSIMPIKTDWDAHLSLKERTKSAARKAVDAQLAKTHGTRVAPVFVLSLDGMENDLLMEDGSQLFVSPDAVIVLQSAANTSTPLNFVSEGQMLRANTQHAQRFISAGLASLLGGLSPPFCDLVIRRQSLLRHDWLWAVGHHPFGPLSNTTTISSLLLDTVQMNAIYAQVDVALREVRLSLKAIDDFSDDFLRTSFGGSVLRPSSSPSAAHQWLQKLFSDPKKMFHPIPHALVERLMANLQDFEIQLVKVSRHLYEHDLKSAHTMAHSMMQFALNFRNYVDDELYTARDQMMCCHAVHRATSHSHLTLLYAGILITVISIYLLVIFFAAPTER